jgi:hypothetical protein
MKRVLRRTYSCGYNFRLPLRGVGPTGRRLDLEKNISFSDNLLALQISDFGYVLDTGKITTEGPAADLLSDEKVKSAYLGKKK